MFVDSSALPEQVVLDAAMSAFDSAGQRCSAARVLLLQEDIADRTIELLRGYMETLLVGDPAQLETDVGPVIDAQARNNLEAHVARLEGSARWLQRAVLPDAAARRGHYFAPVALEIDSLAPLTREVFGPVLHVVRYRAADLDAMVDQVNALGFGLTLGVQTRIEATARRIAARARVGNVYVNRNMIGAVVGVQPFGGCGLSGNGAESGRPVLPASLRHRAHHQHQHHGGGWQCQPADAGQIGRTLSVTQPAFGTSSPWSSSACQMPSASSA